MSRQEFTMFPLWCKQVLIIIIFFQLNWSVNLFLNNQGQTGGSTFHFLSQKWCKYWERRRRRKKKKKKRRFLRAPAQTSAAVSCALKAMRRERELSAAAKTLSPRLFIPAGVEWIGCLRGFVNAECGEHRKTHTDALCGLAQIGAADDACG